MQRTRYNIKNVISFIIIIVFIIYIIFSMRYNKYEIDTTINNIHPRVIWEYVADFSKMRILNPTIIDFEIISDHGNPAHWKYSVLYKERLSHWPYWINNAVGHYSVRINSQNYLVESEHKTCFFFGIYCLKSIGEFKCLASRITDTYCIETVLYQCPIFLGRYCKREVEYQRRAIMKNLTYQFSKKI